MTTVHFTFLLSIFLYFKLRSGPLLYYSNSSLCVYVNTDVQMFAFFFHYHCDLLLEVAEGRARVCCLTSACKTFHLKG